MTKQNIKTGVFNFTYFESEGSFYPEGLPTDWRIDYFTNEFETACITLDENTNRESLEEVLDQNREDPENDFDLAVALLDPQQIDAYRNLLTSHAAQIKTCVVSNSCRQLLPEQLLENGTDIYCLDNQQSLAQKQPQRLSLWQPDHPVKSPIALLPDCREPKTCRSWIEDWLDANPHTELLLWVDAKRRNGQQANATQLEKLRILVELMGH